jgi:hypothetical protein
MPLTSASTLYQGRIVDLSLFPTMISSNSPARLELGGYPKSISGPGKAAQNFIKILLTTKGSNKAHKGLGSNLLKTVQTGMNSAASSTISGLFNSSALEVVNFIRTTWTDSTPVDEKILSVNLIDFSVSPGVVLFKAQLTSGDGSSFPFLIPVNWNTGA